MQLVMASCRTNLIQENDHVMLKKADKLRLFQVQRKRDVWLDKTKFKLDGIIGQPYGSTFEVNNGKLVKLEKLKPVVEEKMEEGLEKEKDNRNLHDLDSNQKLTADEIDQLKKEGVTGGKLIEQLIENSSTFQTKTGYAQEKWVKKKKKKHLQEYTILRPNARLICEMYVSKGPSRIGNLRVDSLAQILALGNVRPHSTVAVLDTCVGIVTGAVLERLGGFGKVISLYYGDTPMKSQLESFDFPREVMDTMYHFPLELVASLKNGNTTSSHQDEDMKTDEAKTTNTTDTKPVCEDTKSVCEDTKSVCEDTKPVCDDTKPVCEDSKTETTDCISNENNTTNQDIQANIDEAVKQPDLSKDDQMKQETHEDSSKNDASNSYKGGQRNRRDRNNKRPRFEDRVAAREARAKDVEAARNVILEKNIDCLILACKFHPTPIVTALLDYIAPSRQIVVFSQFKEALQDCYVHMRESGGLVSYRLTETWLRNYQVLPNRTHPVIQMSGTGGYLLTATTVIKD